MVQMPLTKEHCWNCPLSLMVTHTEREGHPGYVEEQHHTMPPASRNEGLRTIADRLRGAAAEATANATVPRHHAAALLSQF